MIIMKDMEVIVLFVKSGWIMMKFKLSNLCSKLINNYIIESGTPGVGLTNFLEIDDYYAYTGKLNSLKEGYYPKKIVLVGYPDGDIDRCIYLVFKKMGAK